MLEISRYLDHAVLKPAMSQQEAKEAIQLGIDYKVRTVCVRPCDIALAVAMCEGTETEVSCVLSFPHGHGTRMIKRLEAEEYVRLGAKEIDMVVNYGYIKSGEWDLLKADIEAVSSVTLQEDVLLKTIFETCELTQEEIMKATEIAIEAGADYVKTSTGFSSQGATKEAVRAMMIAANGNIKVKASGGIRNFETAKMYVDMGCERLGVGSTGTPMICNQETPKKEDNERY